MADSPLLVVLTTISDVERGKLFARQIITKRLAACCNIVPGISSVFRWENEPNDDEECLIIMKTAKNRYLELEEFVRNEHPYNVPELIALPVEACMQEYLSWTLKETT